MLVVAIASASPAPLVTATKATEARPFVLCLLGTVWVQGGKKGLGGRGATPENWAVAPPIRRQTRVPWANCWPRVSTWGCAVEYMCLCMPCACCACHVHVVHGMCMFMYVHVHVHVCLFTSTIMAGPPHEPRAQSPHRFHKSWRVVVAVPQRSSRPTLFSREVRD